MSDDAAKHFESPPDSTPPPVGRSITLSITHHPNGQVEFHLPSNKVVAYGLLGMAMERLTCMSMMQDVQSQAQRANGGGLNGLLKKMGRGDRCQN